MDRFLKFFTTLLVFAFCAAPFVVDTLNPAAFLPKQNTFSTLEFPWYSVSDGAINQIFLNFFMLYALLVWAYFTELSIGKKHGRVFQSLSILALLCPFLIFLLTVLFGGSAIMFQPVFYLTYFLFIHTYFMFLFLLFQAFHSAYNRVVFAVLFTVLFPVGVVVTQVYILIKGAERVRVSGPVS
ncbi:MAG: hypothetical protein IPH06_06790 [Alphaproteobacteria bacterium]|nr:hypothetical protein [Alphaproteobacteria bacterium]QQS57722.1 MAG: hypothetical protein IPN28_02555 [Alphaproteobacteria bacterium]